MDGTARQRPVLAYLVLQEPAIVLLDILGQIGIKHKRRNLRVGQLRAIFYLDVLSLDGWRWCFLDDGQHHLVELGGSDAQLTVEVHLLSRFQHLEDALLGEGRSEDDGEVCEGGHALADGVLEGLDDLVIFILHQVPFVNHHYQRLMVLLNELENVHILRLDASCGINHEDAHITVLNAADAAHHRIKLKIF